MAKKLGWAGRIVFALAVVFTLGFGARQAFGSPAAMSCDNCASHAECVMCCDAVGSICLSSHRCLCA
jgi:hypothetical protein